MDDDRHRIWRTVRQHIAHLEEHAPDGHAVGVDVYVAGRNEPVRLGVVETTRDGWPWTLLQSVAEEAKAAPGKYPQDVRLVFAPDQAIIRVELYYERTGERTLGFSHHVMDE
jgi:hypothetical protein